jgi:hypothetical protein
LGRENATADGLADRQDDLNKSYLNSRSKILDKLEQATGIEPIWA